MSREVQEITILMKDFKLRVQITVHNPKDSSILLRQGLKHNQENVYSITYTTDYKSFSKYDWESEEYTAYRRKIKEMIGKQEYLDDKLCRILYNQLETTGKWYPVPYFNIVYREEFPDTYQPFGPAKYSYTSKEEFLLFQSSKQ
jgi:hypothetical protein